MRKWLRRRWRRQPEVLSETHFLVTFDSRQALQDFVNEITCQDGSTAAIQVKKTGPYSLGIVKPQSREEANTLKQRIEDIKQKIEQTHKQQR
jgi:hypothetical protein